MGRLIAALKPVFDFKKICLATNSKAPPTVELHPPSQTHFLTHHLLLAHPLHISSRSPKRKSWCNEQTFALGTAKPARGRNRQEGREGEEAHQNVDEIAC